MAASRLTEDVLPPDLFEKLKPEFVVPMALYLCAEACTATGNIYNAGMGFFNRAAVVTGPGTTLTRDGAEPGLEDVEAAMDRINSLKGGKTYSHLNEQIGDVLAALTAPVAESTGETARFTQAADVFAAMPDAFVAEAADGVDVVFQYHIAGDGGGDWHCAIAGNTCTVKAGVHDKPVCTLKIGAAEFLDMMNGTLPAMQAYTSGKLKIEGDIMKSQLIEKLFRI